VAQLGPAQIGLAEIRSREVGARQVALAQIRPGEVLARKVGPLAAGLALVKFFVGVENVLQFFPFVSNGSRLSQLGFGAPHFTKIGTPGKPQG
jgi:hypothetical protein